MKVLLFNLLPLLLLNYYHLLRHTFFLPWKRCIIIYNIAMIKMYWPRIFLKCRMDTYNHIKAQGNQSSCFSTILFIKNIFHNFKIISENQWRSSLNSTFTIKFRSHIFLAQNAWDRKQTSYVIEITEFKLYD